MAINTYGVSPNIGEFEWAVLHRIQQRGAWHEVVDTATDYTVTPVTGTRTVQVFSGDMAVNGVLVRNDAPANVSFAAQSGGNSRIDYVVLEVDWSGTVSTASTIKVIQGTAAASPVAPSLTRVAGTLWQVGLARVSIASGAGQLTTAMIDLCVPQRRHAYIYKSSVDSKSITNDNETEIARTSGADPGWPYILRIEGNTGFGHVAAGHGLIFGNINGSQVTSGTAGALNDADAFLRPEHTNGLTGKWTATMTMNRTGMTADLVTQPARGGLTVTVIPN